MFHPLPSLRDQFQAEIVQGDALPEVRHRSSMAEAWKLNEMGLSASIVTVYADPLYPSSLVELMTTIHSSIYPRFPACSLKNSEARN
jgi:hypothetical protein